MRRILITAVASLALILTGLIWYFGQQQSPQVSNLGKHLVRQISYWQPGRAGPNLRFRDPDTKVLDYVEKKGAADSLIVNPERPDTAAQIEFEEKFMLATADVPEVFWQKVGTRVRAVLPIWDLGSTALTVSLVDGEQKTDQYIMFFDPKRLAMTSNDWLTAKDQSPFNPDGEYFIRSKLSDDETDELSGLTFIIMHELAHAFGAHYGMHPPLDYAPKSDKGERLRQSTFAAISWKTDGKAILVRPEDEMVDHGALFFYAPSFAQADNEDILGNFKDLTKTQFPTLYATTNMYDDFAESLATYIHTEVMGRPYKVWVLKKGQDQAEPILEVGACWREKRCQTKRKIIEDFLASP